MIQLNSRRLRIEMANPGESPNDTGRFDRAGFITEVILDKRHRFCASEPNNLSHPSSGGRGLCSEFLFDVSGQTKTGKAFPKFGVGLFTKPDDGPYCFYKKYEEERFPIEWESSKNSVCFTTLPILCQGYALKCIKTIEADENILTMTVRVENAGERALDLREYCHNFLSIDGMALGRGYKLRLPGIKDMGHEILSGTIKGDGNGFTFSGFNAKAECIHIESRDIKPADRFSWSLVNTDAAASVDVTEFFRPCRLVLWAVDHIISLEAFKEISLMPGQADEWKRSWTFNA
jgi:hypothetical protein